MNSKKVKSTKATRVAPSTPTYGFMTPPRLVTPTTSSTPSIPLCSPLYCSDDYKRDPIPFNLVLNWSDER